MPCNCDGYPEPDPDIHSGVLAEMLCRILKEHEERGEMSCFSTQTLLWWKEHKKRDAARIKEDKRRAKEKATKKAALDKLSKAERKALGLR